MSGIGTGYDLSATTFSPDGKIFQTEYAQKAIDNGSTVVGLKVKDGVVLGVEKLIVSKLLVEGSNRRLHAVDRHAGAAVSGLAPDGRMIVNRAVEEAAAYKRFYGDLIPGHVLAERVASYMHLFNLYWSFRPFGCTMLLSAYDKSGPQLYAIEPSGACVRYFGTAVGKGRQAARNEIEKLKLEEMSAREAVKEVAKILHKVHDEDSKPFELELSWIAEETGWQQQRVPTDLLEEAIRAAKAEAADSDMDD
ncbi:20S proteasome alpha subunit G [Haematococcus lacustris]